VDLPEQKPVGSVMRLADQNATTVTSPPREIFATKGGFCFSTTLRIFGSALRKFSASVSARRLPCAASTNARTFARRIACFSATTVADAFVSCDHNPVVPSSERKPFWIGSILREMLIVNFDFEISASKNAGHFVAAELPIEKEN